MRKLFALVAAALVSVSMWALTEIVPKADNNWEGNSITITHDECANGNTGDYAKFRTNKNSNTLTLNIKEGITVTGISIKAYSYNTGATISLAGVSIDGTAVSPFTPVVFPVLGEAENATEFAKDQLSAKQSIVFSFDNNAVDGTDGKKNKQIMAIVTITYTAPTYKATYVANYEGVNDSIDAEALMVKDNFFPNPDGKYFAGWNSKADGSGDAIAVGGAIKKDTVLYAQWKVFTECLRLTVAAQGEEPAKDKEVALRLGSNTGGKIYFADAKNAFKDDYQYKPTGLQLGGGAKDSLRVVLDEAIAAGAVVRLSLVAVNDGKPAIKIVSGGKSIPFVANRDAAKNDTVDIFYVVKADDGLAGAKVFNLQRDGSVILRSLSIQKDETCAAAAAPYSEDTSLKSFKINGADAKSSEGVYVDTLAADFSAPKVEVTYELNDANAKAEPAGGKFELDTPAAEATTAGKLTVTAQDGTIKEYKISIYKAKAAEPDPQDPDDQAVENIEAGSFIVKTFENGQLIIIKNGIKYNATGAIVK